MIATKTRGSPVALSLAVLMLFASVMKEFGLEAENHPGTLDSLRIPSDACPMRARHFHHGQTARPSSTQHRTVLLDALNCHRPHSTFALDGLRLRTAFKAAVLDLEGNAVDDLSVFVVFDEPTSVAGVVVISTGLAILSGSIHIEASGIELFSDTIELSLVAPGQVEVILQEVNAIELERIRSLMGPTLNSQHPSAIVQGLRVK